MFPTDVIRKMFLTPILYYRIVFCNHTITLLFFFTLLHFYLLHSSFYTIRTGPQDEGAGKRKETALSAYGKLSFEDVAGQEMAKREVSEVRNDNF